MSANLRCVVFDEAQQFGDATDAWLLAEIKSRTLFLFLGDQAQPYGAATSEYAQAVLRLCAQLQPGLANPNLQVSTPNHTRRTFTKLRQLP